MEDRERSPHVEVVGAGPAGLSAALAARAAGAAVTVYERRSDVGARFHGDFQGLENWTLREDVLAELERLGIDTGFDHTAVHEIVCFDAKGAPHRVTSARPMFYLVRRGNEPGSLDSALKRQALAAGVTIRFNERRRHLAPSGVVAEGPHRADVIAAGYVFETDMANGCYAAVSERLAPAGYCYLLIDRGRGTIATCLFEDFHNERRYLDATVEFFTQATGLRWRSASRFGGSGNYGVLRSTVVNGRAYAGEAAGLQDALFGFGLRYSLCSGHLAGVACATGSLSDYDARRRARTGALIAASFGNRWLYTRLGDHGRSLVLRSAGGCRDGRRVLEHIYRPAVWKSALGAIVSKRLLRRAEIRAGCDCTWCRCCKEPYNTAEASG